MGPKRVFLHGPAVGIATVEVVDRVGGVVAGRTVGLDAPLVRVEVYCGPGLPQVNIVGMAETAVRESRDRVQAALVNSGYKFPDGRITVEAAPQLASALRVVSGDRLIARSSAYLDGLVELQEMLARR